MPGAGEKRPGRIAERLRSLGLFTDLYELTMLRAYREIGLSETAVFSLFVRHLPEQRNSRRSASRTTTSPTFGARASRRIS